VSAAIHCNEHGAKPPACICVHIQKSLHDGKKVGFLWSRNDDGEYDAICTFCNTMPFDDWEAQKDKSFVVICHDCFIKAAAFYGISRDELEATRQ
jgi:uncharacterized protein YcgI (DUF1989 family)